MQIATNAMDAINAFREEAIALLIQNGHPAEYADKLRAIPIVINDRLRVTNGHCTWKRIPGTMTIVDLKITMSLDYIQRAEAQFIRNTVSHELAHAYQVQRTGTSGHDRMWRMFHRAMGGTGETHSRNTTPGKRNTVQRVVVKDNITQREHTITLANWKRITGSVRYVFVKQFALQR